MVAATRAPAGSSPRVRGTLFRLGLRKCGSRFIPACAGNSHSCSGRCDLAPVHPRVCGELPAPPPGRLRTAGSSPRVRGTPVRRVWAKNAYRFIPACAGNSRAFSGATSNAPVHPRVCGELSDEPSAPLSSAGSSPRVRGTPVRGARRGAARRFIPACAGNSRFPVAPTLPVSVHPRVCGELVHRHGDALERRGSSPRVRGTPPHPHVSRSRLRFIPACAGNSEGLSTPPSGAPVHPRVCGELLCKVAMSNAEFGSSPRVRGTLKPVIEKLPKQRFIPACAGNSRGSTPPSRHAPVHPRVCGELFALQARRFLAGGSSPRVRGTPQHHAAQRGGGRFIPACAGNSPYTSACHQPSTGSSPRVRGTPSRVRRRRALPPVHPRVCGELFQPALAFAQASGSSPRVRGTLEPSDNEAS